MTRWRNRVEAVWSGSTTFRASVLLGRCWLLRSFPKSSKSKDEASITRNVVICKGANSGVGAIVLAGVTIWEGSVVGANLVVTKEVVEDTMVVGNPAKFIKSADEIAHADAACLG